MSHSNEWWVFAVFAAFSYFSCPYQICLDIDLQINRFSSQNFRQTRNQWNQWRQQPIAEPGPCLSQQNETSAQKKAHVVLMHLCCCSSEKMPADLLESPVWTMCLHLTSQSCLSTMLQCTSDCFQIYDAPEMKSFLNWDLTKLSHVTELSDMPRNNRQASKYSSKAGEALRVCLKGSEACILFTEQ